MATYTQWTQLDRTTLQAVRDIILAGSSGIELHQAEELHDNPKALFSLARMQERRRMADEIDAVIRGKERG